MLVRDTFKVAWLTSNGHPIERAERIQKGFQYYYSGSHQEQECLRQYNDNTVAALPLKKLKDELQSNQIKSQEFTTNARTYIICQ